MFMFGAILKNTKFKGCNLKGARLTMDEHSEIIECDVEDTIIEVEHKKTFFLDRYRTISIINGEIIFHDFIGEEEFQV